MIEARKLGQFLLSAALSAALLRSPTADACCFMQPRSGVVLTTRDTALPEDGGILVGWRYGGGSPTATDDFSLDSSNQPSWTVQIGKAKPVGLTRVSLAPGLSVYTAKAGKADFTLLDGNGTALGAFSRNPKAAKNAMPAPAATSVKLWTVPDFRANDRHALVSLKSAPPAEAVAIIVYQLSKTGNVPISFAKLPDSHDKLTTIEAFQDAGRCGILQPGARPPNDGESVAFAWVDAFGRRSPLSAAIKAKAGAVPQAATPAPVKPAKPAK